MRAFPTPNDLAKFTTEVLGDKRIYTMHGRYIRLSHPDHRDHGYRPGPQVRGRVQPGGAKAERLASSGTGAGTPATYAGCRPSPRPAWP